MVHSIIDWRSSSETSSCGHTLSHLREEYWIPQGQAQARRVLSRCVIFQKFEGSSFQLLNMLVWPRERVSQSKPFQFIGLNYLGPIHVKIGTELKEIWVCLFTCLAGSYTVSWLY